MQCVEVGFFANESRFSLNCVQGCSIMHYVVICCSVLRDFTNEYPCCYKCTPLFCCHSLCSLLQCVAICCRVLPCVMVCCSVSQCVMVCCSVLQCVGVCCDAVWCSGFLRQWVSLLSLLHTVAQCIAMCCNVLQYVAVCCGISLMNTRVVINAPLSFAAIRFAVCCSVLQCVAVCCSVLQRVAACCSVLQRVSLLSLLRVVLQSAQVCCGISLINTSNIQLWNVPFSGYLGSEN